MQVQTADDEVAAAEAKAGGAGEDGFAGNFGADGDRGGLGAVAVEPEIGVFPIACSQDNGVTGLGISNGFAGGLGIRDVEGRGVDDGREEESGEGGFHG